MFYFFSLFVFPITSEAWNALGHMVIANIAYQKLNETPHNKIEMLNRYFQDEYPEMISFLQMSYWPDTLHAQKIETFTHWHYIDIPFSEDGTPLKNITDTDNAAWAVNTMEPILQNKYTNPYEAARFLAFFTHIVGDMHQPLHNVSRLSNAYPDGDRGGNLFFIRFNNARINLHQLWDRGLGEFDSEINNENIAMLSKKITERYPENYFGDRVNDLDPQNWAKEGMENARKYVYVTPENQIPNPDYIEAGRQITEQEVALAGYRLAKLLNQMLTMDRNRKSRYFKKHKKYYRG